MEQLRPLDLECDSLKVERVGRFALSESGDVSIGKRVVNGE